MVKITLLAVGVLVVLLIAAPTGATTFEATGGFAQYGHVDEFHEGIARITGPGLNVVARTFDVPDVITAGNALATGSTTIAYGEGFFNDFYLGPPSGTDPWGIVRLTFTHPPITGLAGITSLADLLARSAAGVVERAPFTMTGVVTATSSCFCPSPPVPTEVATLVGDGIVTARLYDDGLSFGRALYEVSYDFTPVPEPSTALLLGLGVVAVAVARRKFISR
jgi:hypothetical protein